MLSDARFRKPLRPRICPRTICRDWSMKWPPTMRPMCWAILGGCVWLAMGAAVVPLVFRRIGVDPAVASGPLITTLNDGLSLLLYFGIAAFFL